MTRRKIVKVLLRRKKYKNTMKFYKLAASLGVSEIKRILGNNNCYKHKSPRNKV